jgi:HEPN domain-containing protein
LNNMKIMLSNARSFRLAAINCCELRPVPSGLESYLVPGVVNYAFACELYLKVLLLQSGVEHSRQHNLTKLFRRLPDELQGDVKIAMNIECFDSILDKVSNNFLEFRYLYEMNEAFSAIGFLHRFSTILEKLAEARL